MSFSVVQHKVGTTFGSTPTTLAFASATTAGNAVVVFGCASVLATVPTVSSTHDTYANVDRASDATDSEDMWSFYKLNITGGDTTITFTQAAGTAINLGIIELHSTTGWGALVSHSAAHNAVANQAAVCGSLGASGNLILYGAYINGLGETPSATGGGSLLDGGTGTSAVATGDTNTAAGAVTPGFSWTATTGNEGWAICGLAFSPGAAGCNSEALLGVGCSVGWRASLLAGAAWRARTAIEKNGIITRRRLILPSRGC